LNWVLEESAVCPYCGYSLRGIASDVCPECGKRCPRAIRDLPSCALLPWERRIQTLAVCRFLRTISFATCHYIRYLRALRCRDNAPVYKGTQLADWITLAALVTPPAVSALSSVLYFVGRYVLSGQWRRALDLWVGLEATWHAWFIWIPQALVLVGGLCLIAGIIRLTTHLHLCAPHFTTILCATGPPVIVLVAVQQFAATAVTRLAGIQSRDWSTIEVWIVVSMTSIGVPMCCWLALRIVWDVALRAATLAAILIALTDYWFWPFVQMNLMRALASWQ